MHNTYSQKIVLRNKSASFGLWALLLKRMPKLCPSLKSYFTLFEFAEMCSDMSCYWIRVQTAASQCQMQCCKSKTIYHPFFLSQFLCAVWFEGRLIWSSQWIKHFVKNCPVFSLTYPLNIQSIRAPKMTSQPVSSIFLCSPLPSGTWRTPGMSIPWCCLPTSFSACLVFFPLSLRLARWFWPDLMNGRHVHTTSVCISLRWSGGHRVVWVPARSRHRLPLW